MSSIELEGKIRELRQLQSLIDEAQAEVETIKDVIKACMAQEDVLRSGEYTVTWKSVNAVRLDVRALREALPDVAARFTVETTTRRFCVA